MDVVHLDKQFTLWINSFHSPFWDPIMVGLSATWIWIPFYALLIFLLAQKYRRQSWIILLFIVVLVVFADQGSVQLFKNTVCRLRPCHDPEVMPFLHQVNGKCGGTYGFVSSHASNTFALATFMFIQLRPYYRYAALMFFWAAVVSYSRIYLGVHFFGDVLCGALFGVLCGLVVVGLLKYTTFLFSKKSSSKKSSMEKS